jgi:hypothetical protein
MTVTLFEKLIDLFQNMLLGLEGSGLAVQEASQMPSRLPMANHT